VSTTWIVILGSAAATFAIKAAGPVALGGRQLPGAFNRVIALLAPAILAALIVTAALADGDELAVGADTVGVAAGALVVWRLNSVVGSVVVAAGVTALLRALGVS
jgi:branched-subunit amino acid transport protein